MKTVKLTKLQLEEIGYCCELLMERRESDKDLFDDHMDGESLYDKLNKTKSNKPISFSVAELEWIKRNMMNQWDIHGSMETRGDYEELGYHNMCKNLFKKLK